MENEDKKNKTRKEPGALRQASKAIRIVIGGGGTGGHLFPGIALAQEFLVRNPENSILFVGSGKPFEISVLSEAGFAHKRITAEGFKGRGIWHQIVSVSKVPKGVLQSVVILCRFKPHLVIGVGGYSAGPLVMGAWLLGIKSVLHEQNILPGITNRILSRFAERIYVSFQETKFESAPQKIRYFGNPVRREILRCAKTPNNGNAGTSKKQELFTILILGGSQGAHRINMALLEAIEHIEGKENIFFVHQTGAGDETRVKETYDKYGLAHDTRSFFKDMARQYQKADLVICRAGATTVAEVKAVGKGVIFIPFPYAADNHQVLNAQSLEKEGAAEMILEKDLSGSVLAARINHYARHPEALHRMASRCANLFRVDAAGMIVDDCYDLMS